MTEPPQPSEPSPDSARRTVLILIDSLGTTGGGERIALELAVSLDPARFERILCVSRWDSEATRSPVAVAAIAAIEGAGVELIGLERRSRLDLAPWRKLIRVLRERPVDILHTHKFGSNVWGALLAPRARTPVFVAHEHTWSYQGQPWRRLLDRELIARRADAFVAVSSEDRRRMIEVERIDPAKVVLIPNGVPIPEADENADVRAELEIAAARPTFGTVCVLRPQKALDVLLEATVLVRRRFADACLLIAGDGPERARLEARATELRIRDTVTFAGMRTDVPEVLTALDVWVSSSDFEGAPLAVLEAMDAALPIVATRVGGIPDLIEDGVQGLLVEPRDPVALAGAICELLSDRAKAARIGAAARERRRSEFGVETMASRTAALYEGLYARALAGG